jgi:head-tail adaptor
MIAPRLNRQMVLETCEREPDAAGGVREAWVPLGTVWAERRARTGRERSSEAGALSVTGVRITVRAMPEGASSRPRAGQRLREGAQVFHIKAVSEADASGRYLICQAVEELGL